MDRATIRDLRRSHGYPQFFIAVTVARVADEMFGVGVLLLILERTDSPSLGGAMLAAATLPGVVTGPLIGAWLDRTARRSLIYTVDRLLLTTVLLLILLTAGHVPNVLVLVLAVLTGITLPATFSGFTSMLPLMVEKDLLLPANALESASYNIALIAGPALAGAIAGAASPGATVLAEAGLTVLALALILRIPDLNRGAMASTLAVRQSVVQGLRHVARERVLRIVSLAGVFPFLAWGVLIIVFPLWAAADLHAARSASGVLWSAYAAGSLLGGLALARFQARHAQEWVVLGGMIAMGLGMFSWIPAGSLAVAMVLILLTAIASGPEAAAGFSVRQERTPAGLQAQVTGTVTSIQVGAFAIGSLLAGPAVEAFGPRACIAFAAGSILAAGGIGAALRARVARSVDSPA